MTAPPPAGAGVEPVPAAAASVFADRLPLAERYAESLVGAGILRGLVGPREGARIWSRHLLNCAVLQELLPQDARVVDVGSGAGLPGLVLAIARPDLTVDLVEPLLRRATYLTDVVQELGLGERVRIVRGRAEDRATQTAVGSAAVVTARAVAPLDRLVKWCLPLLAPDGVLLALKGANAADEIAEHRASLARMGAGRLDVVECGAGLIDPPTAVIRIRRSPRTNKKGRR